MAEVYAMGKRELTFGSNQLNELRDGTGLRDDVPRLRERLAEDGYLLLRNLLPRDRVAAARQRILAGLCESGEVDTSVAIDYGRALPAARGGMFRDEAAMARSPELLGAVEAPELATFFEQLFGGAVATTTHKWVRATAPGGCTGAHMDVVYMGRGTQRLLTAWIPLGDINKPMGSLAVLPGSHRLPSFERVRATYGKMDVDRDNVGGWFSNDPLELVELGGVPWLTSDFSAGDVLIFTIYTMHMSLTNTSDRFRLTCDVRWQRADEAQDPRWFGDSPLGHYAWMATPPKDMADARREWDV